MIEGLRSRIRQIERRVGPPAPAAASHPSASARDAWTFGDVSLEARWPPDVLALDALHELKPASVRDWPATLAFALRLAARRLAGHPAARAPMLLWCASSAFTAEHGCLHAAGLRTLGLPPEAMVVVETHRDAETLWALEEGLRSRAPVLVAGGLDGASLVASRRLSLAAAEAGLPCLLATGPGTAPAPAAATRWRLSRLPSGAHPLDPEAPGPSRLCLSLERCRRASAATPAEPQVVEWCDVTHRFRLAAVLADRQAVPGTAPADRRPAAGGGPSLARFPERKHRHRPAHALSDPPLRAG